MRVVACVVASLVLISVSTGAWADQCEALSANVARTAARILPKGTRFTRFCAPCGDKHPGPIEVVSNIEIVKTGDHFEIAVNGSPVDLAYIFVVTRASSDARGEVGHNAAMMSGCQAAGVDVWITLAPSAGTWSGYFDQAQEQQEARRRLVSTITGTWSITTQTQLTTCQGDAANAKAVNAWVVSANGQQLHAKSTSGATFTGRLDSSGRCIWFQSDAAPSSVLTQLCVQDGNTLSGRQVAGAVTGKRGDPVCETFRTVAATKAN